MKLKNIIFSLKMQPCTNGSCHNKLLWNSCIFCLYYFSICHSYLWEMRFNFFCDKISIGSPYVQNVTKLISNIYTKRKKNLTIQANIVLIQWKFLYTFYTHKRGKRQCNNIIKYTYNIKNQIFIQLFVILLNSCLVYI